MLFPRLVIAGIAVAIAVQAQTAPPPDQAPPKEKVAVSQTAGDFELGLFAGAVIPPGTNGASLGGGANFAYALNTWIYPYVEFSVLPGALDSTLTVSSLNTSYKTTGDLADFHGGVHIRIPVNRQFVPYGVFAVGAFKPYSETTQQFNLATSSAITNPVSVQGNVQFAFNYGGGIRVYLTNLIGVRFEATAYGPNSHFNGTPVRIMAGVFFQFKKK